MLLHAGAVVDLVDHKGMTALHYVAKIGNDKIAAALLQAGAAVDLVDPDGWSALHWAASFVNHKIVAILLQPCFSTILVSITSTLTTILTALLRTSMSTPFNHM